MHRFVYFDLETIPSQSPSYLERVRGKIKPPGNIKKAESIDTWMAENAEQAALEEVSKSSFDGGRGHICTIAWAKDDGEVKCFHAANLAEEKPLVAAFFNALDPYHSENPGRPQYRRL
jgi:3'-5' exonuclease